MTTTRTLKPGLPSRRTMVSHILACYRSATDAQLAKGVSWYPDARSIALALDPADVDRAAGVIAAISPQQRWKRNIILAARTYADGFASSVLFPDMVNRILAGEAPADVLKGPKTNAFYRTIVDPTVDAVVVDRHALSVACGHIATDAEWRAFERKGGYDAVSEAYRAAARHLGVVPSVVQAVTWVVWRETMIRNRRAAQREDG